ESWSKVGPRFPPLNDHLSLEIFNPASLVNFLPGPVFLARYCSSCSFLRLLWVLLLCLDSSMESPFFHTFLDSIYIHMTIFKKGDNINHNNKLHYLLRIR